MRNSAEIFGEVLASRTAFMVERAEKRDDSVGKYLAAVVKSLNVYAVLKKVDENDRQK
jgi:hypothetical protein